VGDVGEPVAPTFGARPQRGARCTDGACDVSACTTEMLRLRNQMFRARISAAGNLVDRPPPRPARFGQDGAGQRRGDYGADFRNSLFDPMYSFNRRFCETGGLYAPRWDTSQYNPGRVRSYAEVAGCVARCPKLPSCVLPCGITAIIDPDVGGGVGGSRSLPPLVMNEPGFRRYY
jgi:hypothetical protein